MDIDTTTDTCDLPWDPEGWSDDVRIHAILMLIGWGFFIPVALFTTSHISYRQGSNHRSTWELHVFGVHFHMAVGAIGTIFAIVGFGYGLNKFTTFERDNVSTYRMVHAVVGTIASAGAMIQVLLMLIMRKPKYENQRYKTWPLWQKIGHFTHRGFGFLVFLFGLIACETGTHMTSVHHPGCEHLSEQNEKYSGALICVLLAAAITTALMVQTGKFVYLPRSSGGADLTEKHDDDDIHFPKDDYEETSVHWERTVTDDKNTKQRVIEEVESPVELQFAS